MTLQTELLGIGLPALIAGGCLGGALLMAGLAWRRHRHARAQALASQIIFQNAGGPLLLIDQHDLILRVNGDFEQLVGMGREEIEGQRTWLSFMAADERDALERVHGLRCDYEFSAPAACNAVLHDKLGKVHDVALRFGHLPGAGQWLIALSDQTRHKRALVEARLAEARYRNLFENATLGIFQTTPDGQYLSANAALASIYGYGSPDELMRHLTNIENQLYVDPNQRGRFREQVNQTGELREFESQVYRRDGGVIWIVENARAVCDEQGQVLYYEGLVENITQRKEHEAALRSQNEVLARTIAELETAQSTLVEQERLRALGQMASGIAHDFNNTLSPIIGFTELLLKRPQNLKDPEKTKRYLEMIYTSAKDATNVVRCLREFYRLRSQADPGAPIDLNVLIDQTIQLTQPRWRNQAQASGIQIKMEFDAGAIPRIYGVESSLREALTNLIFNAVDAMPQGGSLSLATARVGDQVRVTLADTGSGMSPEVRKHCLDPFFTTKGCGGTGLGLSMVYGIVTRHGGTIEIHSELGVGTTFTLLLPLNVRPRGRQAEDEVESIARELRVLVMEDDPLVREVLLEYLQGDGCDVSAATNGREGLALYQPDRFDLVLTDKSMPEMSGDQVAAEIKKLNSSQAIVMLTGFGDMMEVAGEHPIGVDFVLSKPITLNALRDIIGQVQALHASDN